MKAMDSIVGPMGVGGLVALLLGCALLWFGLHGLLERRRWSEALGTVVSHGPVQPGESVGLQNRYPMEIGIEFHAQDGQAYRISKTVYATDVIPDYNIGAPVTVGYRADDPRGSADPEPAGLAAGSVFLLMLGLLLMLPTLLFAAIERGFLESVFARNATDGISFVVCTSAATALFLVPALALCIGQLRFQSGAVEGQLRVVGFQKDAIVISHHESEAGSAGMSTEAEYAQLELSAPNQQPQRIGELMPQQGSRPYTAGQVLRVRYRPQDPRHWVRDRWSGRWLGPVLLGGAGLLLIGAGWLMRPGAKELADQARLEKAFDRLDSARGDKEREQAASAVFEAAEQAERPAPAAAVVDSFAPEKLRPVISLWQGLVQKGPADFFQPYSLKATDPVPERWPAQPGDGLVYYVFPAAQVMPGVENQAEPIAQVTVRAGKSPLVEPLAQLLAPLGSTAATAQGKAQPAEAELVARAWVAQKRSFAKLSPSAQEALRQYYCRRLGSGDRVLPKMLRLHHGEFLQWLSCPP